MHIQPISTWTAEQIAQVVALVEHSNAHESIQVRINPDWLADRKGDTVQDWLAIEDAQIVGVLSLFVFGKTVEVTGTVHPNHRRRGIFSALAETAVKAIQQQEFQRILWIIPDQAPSGVAWLKTRPATYKSSEYSMQLEYPPTNVTLAETLQLRPTTRQDLPWMIDVMIEGFNMERTETEAWLNRTIDDQDRTYYGIIDAATPVGVIGVQHQKTTNTAYIYGFVVHPIFRGRGIGRQVLQTIAQQLHTAGYHVELEVETKNEHALGLYTSSGFKSTSVYDYYLESVHIHEPV